MEPRARGAGNSPALRTTIYWRRYARSADIHQFRGLQSLLGHAEQSDIRRDGDLMASLRKNVASQHISFGLVNSSTGAALTGATFTGKAWVAKDGAQAGFGGTFTELGNGQYDYAPTQAETNCTSFGLAINPTSSILINLQMFTDNWDTS